MGEEFEDIQNNMLGNPIPLNFFFPNQASDWVIHKVKEIQHNVGIECDGNEEQFMALLTTIEAGHQQRRKGNLRNCGSLNV